MLDVCELEAPEVEAACELVDPADEDGLLDVCELELTPDDVAECELDWALVFELVDAPVDAGLLDVSDEVAECEDVDAVEEPCVKLDE